MSSSNTDSSLVALKDPEDWDKWISVKKFATNEEIWEYIDPYPKYDALNARIKTPFSVRNHQFSQSVSQFSQSSQA